MGGTGASVASKTGLKSRDDRFAVIFHACSHWKDSLFFPFKGFFCEAVTLDVVSPMLL